MAFLMAPILVVIPSAFSDDVAVTFPPVGFSLKWFQSAVSQPGFVSAFGTSALVATIATAISICIGSLAAYALVRYRFRGRRVIELLLLTPMIVPSIVLAIALTMILGQLGLLRSMTGLVIAHTILTLPYAVRALTGALHQVDVAIEEASLTLGARPLQMWRLVIFPLIRPGLLAAAVFGFIMSFDEFAVSFFIVGPGLNTLPIELFNYTEINIDPTVSAVSTVLIVLSIVAVFLIERTVGLARLMG
jgi:putative spermidine/putrescine transport system permease protein